MAGKFEAASGALTLLAFFSAFARFAWMGVIDEPVGGVGPGPPSNGYVAEDDVTNYVAEDGATYYVQEM